MPSDLTILMSSCTVLFRTPDKTRSLRMTDPTAMTSLV